MNTTGIEWCDFTWNPITGCPGMKVSPGCANCYAERTINTRLRHLYSEERPFEHIHFHPERLDQPRKLKKPSRIFVGSMCDLFHDDVEVEVLEPVFWEFSKCRQHTFMLLTKRPEKMRWWFSDGLDLGALHPNVWIGVTVCNQAEADAKIPVLLDTPAAKRFVSVEPMLGPVEVGKYLYGSYECALSCGTRLPCTELPEKRCTKCGFTGPDDYETWGDGDCEECPKCGQSGCCGEIEEICPDCGIYLVQDHPDTRYIDWVICGGETGPGARPMNAFWAHRLAEQCCSAGVPFFFKGWGDWTPAWYRPDGGHKVNPDADIPQGYTAAYHAFPENPGIRMYKVGKRRSGRLLDGRAWNEVPS